MSELLLVFSCCTLRNRLDISKISPKIFNNCISWEKVFAVFVSGSGPWQCCLYAGVKVSMLSLDRELCSFEQVGEEPEKCAVASTNLNIKLGPES